MATNGTCRCWDSRRRPERTFMRCLRIARFFGDRSVELRNRRLLRGDSDGVRETTLDSMAD